MILWLLVMIMALFRDCGTVDITTGAAGTTFTVTTTDPDAGTFEPKFILFWFTGRSDTIDAAGTANIHAGLGMAASTSSRRAVAIESIDDVGTTDSTRAQQSDCCIVEIAGAGADTVTGKVDLDAMLSTGFRLVVDDAFTAGRRVHWLALGGDDITNVELGNLTLTAATGDQSVTSLAFQPDCVIFIGAGYQSNTSADDTEAVLSFGVAAGTAAGDNACLVGATKDNVGTSITSSYCLDGESTSSIDTDNSDSVNRRGRVTEFLSNGFTVNRSEGAVATGLYYAAIKGPRFKLLTLTTETDTVTSIAVTGAGFQPKAAIFASHCRAESTANAVTAHLEMSVGFAVSASVRGAQAANDEDNLPTSDTGTAVEHDAVYANLSTSMAIEGLMDLVSFDSDGFTCIMDDADPSQAFVWVLTIGATADTALPPRPAAVLDAVHRAASW